MSVAAEPKARPKRRIATAKKAAWQKAFLETLSAGGSATLAARNARIHRSVAYKQRLTDEEFAAAWDDAIEAGTDALEDVAFDRAVAGSDLLTIFMLKARRPGKFRDNARVEITGKDAGPIEIAVPKLEEAVGILSAALGVPELVEGEAVEVAELESGGT